MRLVFVLLMKSPAVGKVLGNTRIVICEWVCAVRMAALPVLQVHHHVFFCLKKVFPIARG